MQAFGSFKNEPVLELRRSAVRAQLADALQRVDRQLPLTVPVSIGSSDSRGGSSDPRGGRLIPRRVVWFPRRRGDRLDRSR